jgi:3-methyladenine DNA glycosylase/8-oxoguanine DNA glycosylase
METNRTKLFFLLFGLGRADVWAVSDYGIKVAVANQFKLRMIPDVKKMEKIGARWKPYRSVASWYLWRSLEFAKQDE